MGTFFFLYENFQQIPFRVYRLRLYQNVIWRGKIVNMHHAYIQTHNSLQSM